MSADWSDAEFLTYVEAHTDTPRCGLAPEQLARLCRLAGRQVESDHWSKQVNQVVNCNRFRVRDLVAEAKTRLV